MNLRTLTAALAFGVSAIAQAANGPAPAAPAPIATPQTPEAWLTRMTDFTQNASAYRDPRVFVPWANAVTEPGFMIAGMQGAMDPAGWLNMMNSMAHPDALRNWMWVADPNAYMKWMQAGLDPAFYTAVLAQMSDPGKLMRWAMMPMDPKLWNLMLSTMNPNTYIRWGMAGMDPRMWNLMGNTMNPALYTGMLGAVIDPKSNPGLSPWLNWRPPAPVVGASNPWGGQQSASFNLFDPALLANMTSFLPTLLPGQSASVPAPAPAPSQVAQAPAQAVPAAPAAPATTAPAKPEPAHKAVLSGDALFKLGKSGIKDLSAEGKAHLDALADKIKKLGDIEQIKIVGHADASGKAAANQKLSEARARSVKSYLVAKGVKSGVIVTSGAGASQPVVQCDMKLPSKELADCLAPNRRVEVEVIAKVK
jgi:outer membrane protein OmpA-like peptidoglycan-associated protein